MSTWGADKVPLHDAPYVNADHMGDRKALLTNVAHGDVSTYGSNESLDNPFDDDESRRGRRGGRPVKPWCRGRLTNKGCAILAVSVAVAIVGLALIVVYPVGRAIAEHMIGSSEIHFTGMYVSSFTDEFRPQVSGYLTKPSPIDVHVNPFQVSVESPVGDQVIQIGVFQLPALQIIGGENLYLNFTAPFRITNPEAFGKAGKQFIQAKHSFWHIIGDADVKFSVIGIPIHYNDITIEKTITLEGMNSLRVPDPHNNDTGTNGTYPVTMKDIIEVTGQPGLLSVTVTVVLHNPSYITAHMDDLLKMNTTFRGELLGYAQLQHFTVHPGASDVRATFLMEQLAGNDAAIQAFILAYVRAEKNLPIEMLGTAASTSNPLLRPVVDGLDLGFDFKPPPFQFINYVNIRADLLKFTISASVNVFNPLPTPIHVEVLDVGVYIEPGQLFVYNLTQTFVGDDRPVIEPKSNTTVVLDLPASGVQYHLAPLEAAAKYVLENGGILPVTVKGPVYITIGEAYKQHLQYEGNHIEASLKIHVL